MFIADVYLCVLIVALSSCNFIVFLSLMPVICWQRKATERATKSALEQRSVQCKERLDGASCFHSMDNGLWSFEVGNFSHSCFSKAHLIKEPGMGAVATPGGGANGDPGGSDAGGRRWLVAATSPPEHLMHVVFLML